MSEIKTKLTTIEIDHGKDEEGKSLVRSAMAAARKSGVIVLSPEAEFSGVFLNNEMYAHLFKAAVIIMHALNQGDLAKAQSLYKLALLILDSADVVQLADLTYLYHHKNHADTLEDGLDKLLETIPAAINDLILGTKGGAQ